MKIALSEARGRLADLVRRAESGEEVIVTRHGKPTVRLVAVEPVRPARSPEERKAAIDEIMAEGRRRRLLMGTSSAAAQAELYDEYGLPA